MKKFLKIAFLAALIVGTVLIIRQHSRMPYQKNGGKIFGTTYHITYQCEDDLHEQILAELQKVDQSLSMFNENSTISRVNRNEEVDLRKDPLFVEVFTMAQRISEETDGAFDITVAPLVNAWGFGFKNEEMPTDAAVDSIRQFVGCKKVEIQPSTLKIQKTDPRTMLDCSAIAKGFGCDLVAKLFRRKNVANFMIEVGGEVVVGGVNEKGEKWHIGVTKPQENPEKSGEELQTILELPLDIEHSTFNIQHSTFTALATSGNYRNFYVKDGRRYAHTIDPRTGKPVQHSILSATVVANSCALADAYATAFMVADIDEAKRILERHPELLAYLIYSDANGEFAVWASPELKSEKL